MARTPKTKICEPAWKTKPIDCTCNVQEHGKPCDLPTVAAYPTWGGGWMALCYKHSLKHPEATPTDQLIQRGESWT